LPELDTAFGEGVNAWGFVGGGFVDVVAADILPAEIVREDENDVWFRWPVVGEGQEGGEKREDENSENHGMENGVQLATYGVVGEFTKRT
jgi:hypothetical protein